MARPAKADTFGDLDLTEVGRAIRDARLKRGWTVVQLAARSNVSKNQILATESGKNLSLKTLAKLAVPLGLVEIPLVGVRLVAAGGGSINLSAAVEVVERLEAELRTLRQTLAQPVADTTKQNPPRLRGLPRSSSRASDGPASASQKQGDTDRPVRIYLVEDDEEHAAWRERMIDFASRSKELAWREGRHTPAKYKSPLQGEVAAGHGAFLQPVNDEDLRQIPDHYWEKRGARFALRITGDSLVERGILPRDLVFVKPLVGEEPKPESIVIAELDEQIVCKIWRKVKGKPMLYSANPAHSKPIDPSRFAHFAVKGVVVGRSGDTIE